MKIKIGSQILKAFPAIHYTVILIKDVDNRRKISNLSQLVRGAAVVAKNDLKKIDKKDLLNQVAEIELEDGSTFLESYLLSSRVKKIQNGKDVEGSNNLVNFMNLISLKYFLPIHGIDLDLQEMDYVMEFYQPKKGKKTPEVEFLTDTRQVALWFPNLGGWTEEGIDHLVAEINVLLNKYFFTQIAEVFYLDEQAREVDLGYESEKEREYNLHKDEREAEERLKVESEMKVEEVKTAESQVLAVTSEPVEEVEETALPVKESADVVAKRKDGDWKHPVEQIKHLLVEVLEENFPELSSLEIEKELIEMVEVETPKELSHGDFSSNIAMKLGKSLGQTPRDMAAKIVQKLTEKLPNWPVLTSVEAVGPGFLNFRLAGRYFQEELEVLLRQKEKFGLSTEGAGQKLMVDFGSLNIAKPFGAHHLMTTVIGQTLVNLYKALGYNVLAVDFPGDWGTQFGKALYAYKTWGDSEKVAKDPMVELLKLYVRFHEEAEKEPGLEDIAREEFRKLEQGDLENLQLWKWMVELSIRDIDKIYQTLGVKHDRRFPESKYYKTFQEVLQKGKNWGIFVEGEKGAFIVDLEAEGLPPAVVQKSDGTSLYITRDLASIEDRLKSEPDVKKLIYVVDSAQTLHFKQLFAVVEKLHRANNQFPTGEFKHVPYGRMGFADGGMSTRKGNVIMATDLIKEGFSRSEAILNEKMATAEEKLSENEIKMLTHGLAIGAIKYAMLTQAPESDFTFDWDKVLSFEGNSAPYLQYTYARSQSILRKAASVSAREEVEVKAEKKESEGQISLFSEGEAEGGDSRHAADLVAAADGGEPFALAAEQSLLRLLVVFPEKVAAAAGNFKPNILSNYLHELAQTFNSFYGSVPVLKTNHPELLEARLKLVKATAQVLKNGLGILGIAVFERM